MLFRSYPLLTILLTVTRTIVDTSAMNLFKRSLHCPTNSDRTPIGLSDSDWSLIGLTRTEFWQEHLSFLNSQSEWSPSRVRAICLDFSESDRTDRPSIMVGFRAVTNVTPCACLLPRHPTSTPTIPSHRAIPSSNTQYAKIKLHKNSS